MYVVCYMYCGQLLSSAVNVEITRQLALFLRFMRWPAVFAGDWQNDPRQMVDSGVLEFLGLQLALPAESDFSYTCTSKGGRRMLNYFLVSPSLQQAVKRSRVEFGGPFVVHCGVSS